MADEVDLYGDLYNDAEAAPEEETKPELAAAAVSTEEEKPFVQQSFYAGNANAQPNASGSQAPYGNQQGGGYGGAQQQQNQQGGQYDARGGGGDAQGARPADMPEEGSVSSLVIRSASSFRFASFFVLRYLRTSACPGRLCIAGGVRYDTLDRPWYLAVLDHAWKNCTTSIVVGIFVLCRTVC